MSKQKAGDPEAGIGDASVEAGIGDASAEAGIGDASAEAGIGDASAEAGIGDASAEAGIGYASALKELETILAELEDDNIDIDVLSVRVERAAELISVCRNRIRKADERVSRIVADLDPDETPPLDAES